MTIELREEARRREAERELLARKKEEFARDLRDIASRPEGKRFFRWLLNQGDIFRTDYQSGQYGAFQAGQRAFALRLWHLLREHLDEPGFFAIALCGDAQEQEQAAADVSVTAVLSDFFPFES